MKLALFTMFRNEAPILGAFLDQLDEFFDYAFLVNHESADASTDIVKKRQKPGVKLFHLKSPGYPQSELATHFAHTIFRDTDADWLFFLDCDEFLPFRSRNELVTAIRDKSDGHDALRLSWRNLLPKRLDGGDIFSAGFLSLQRKSEIGKLILSRRLVQRAPKLLIVQGYHAAEAMGVSFSCNDLSEIGLLHIPVQSKYRFASKIKAAGLKLIDEMTLYSQGLGYHWVAYHRQLEQQGIRNFNFAEAALYYSESKVGCSDKIVEVDFKFDYLKMPYSEDFDDLFTQLYGGAEPKEAGPSLLYDDHGTLLRPLVSGTASAVASTLTRTENAVRPTFEPDRLGLGEVYNDVIEPLFSLPLRLPESGVSGHIPFLFVLFRLMRPRSFVELGVQQGANLIAAATAANNYQVPGILYGVDSWADREGTAVYEELGSFLEHNFKSVQLVRAHFDQASALFAPESIDLLYLSGQHTHDAVKHDLMTWLPKMSSSGVIVFHNTSARNQGYGVYRLWADLEKQFTTLQFPHSSGLGVLLLNDQSECLTPLVRIIRSPDFVRFYQSLVANISALTKIRMQYLEDPTGGGQTHKLEAENQRLLDEIKYLRAESLTYKQELKSLGVLGIRRFLGLTPKR